MENKSLKKKMKRTDRSSIDWIAIETEYRAGQLSVSHIARVAGISGPAIHKHAAKYGWSRNLAERIKDNMRPQLMRMLQKVEPDVKIAEHEIIEKVSARTLGVIECHRAAAVEQQEEVQRLSRNARLFKGMRLADLKDLSIIARNLSASFDTLVKIERQAYGLDVEGDGSKKVTNVLIIEDCNAHLEPSTEQEGQVIQGEIAESHSTQDTPS